MDISVVGRELIELYVVTKARNEKRSLSRLEFLVLPSLSSSAEKMLGHTNERKKKRELVDGSSD